MKLRSFITVPGSLILLAFSVFLFSCKASREFAENQYAARDKNYKNFIQTKEGTIYEVDAVVFRNPLFGKSTVEIGNGQKINTKEILAYQDNTAYYHRVEGQLAPRIKGGLINMYMTSQTYSTYETNSSNVGGGRWTTRTSYVYYLQKGDDGAIVRYTPDVLEEYVKDYPPAYEYMLAYRKQKKKTKMWSLINTTATVGGLTMLAANSSSQKMSVSDYAGVGLFVGGLASGVVNKIHKSKNYKKLDLALETYNSQRPKKTKEDF